MIFRHITGGLDKKSKVRVAALECSVGTWIACMQPVTAVCVI